MEFSDVASEPISTDDLAKALEWVPIVKQWAENVNHVAYVKAQQGIKIPGYKLVAKRATRSWTDEKEVAKFLEREFTPTTLRSLYEDPALKSVAQMEKTLHKNQFPKLAPFISKISSGESLVPESDPRPEVKILEAKQEFDLLELID